MQLPVRLHSKASPLLSGALSAAHLLVFAGLIASGLSMALALGAGLLLAISLAYAWRNHLLHPAWSSMTLLADGHLEVEWADGSHHGAELLTGSTVHPWLVVLRLRGDGRRLSLALLPDGVAGDGHRLLRLWLRWRAAPV